MRKLVAIAAAVALMVGAVAPAAYAGGSTGTNVALGLASFAVFNQLVGPLLHPRPYVREVVVERPVYVAPAPVVVVQRAPAYPNVIQYPNGRYELHGDGIYTAYQWIWIPNPRRVRASRPPLQHRRRAPRAGHPRWFRPRGPRYNGVRYGDVDERGPSGPDGRSGRCRTTWWSRTAW